MISARSKQVQELVRCMLQLVFWIALSNTNQFCLLVYSLCRKPREKSQVCGKKGHTYGIKNTFASGLVYITRIGLSILERAHKMTVHLCKKLDICYVDNRNIRMKHLGKDGLHLVESSKIILTNNFLSYLSKRIHHPGLFT